MTLRIPAKVLLHVWSYDFYDMALSTGKQRRHMIIQSFNPFRIKFMKNDAHAHMNDLSIINLVLY